MDQFELIRLQARDTIEFCGQQLHQCNDDIRENFDRV